MRVSLVVNTANAVAFMSTGLMAGPHAFQLGDAWYQDVSGNGVSCASFQHMLCILLQSFLPYWMQALAFLCTKLQCNPFYIPV